MWPPLSTWWPWGRGARRGVSKEVSRSIPRLRRILRGSSSPRDHHFHAPVICPFPLCYVVRATLLGICTRTCWSPPLDRSSWLQGCVRIQNDSLPVNRSSRQWISKCCSRPVHHKRNEFPVSLLVELHTQLSCSKTGVNAA